MRNPHFDDGLVVWSDDYSGRYAPPTNGYSEQFDLQWKMYLDGGFERSSDASVEEEAIADRIYEWTGRHPGDVNNYLQSGGGHPLDIPLDVGLIKDKVCIDVGCGLGRWTRVMLKLGAQSVLSIDMSDSALAGVRKFNDNTLQADFMEIPSQHPELVGKFDFANLWGVLMFNHDPLKAFLSASSTVKPGGALFLEVYAPEGMHGTKIVNLRRKRFATLPTLPEKFAYLDRVYDRKWDTSSPLPENVKNVLRNVLGRPKGTRIGIWDMLKPFYNWVIPLEVIEGWMKKGGFSKVQLLNEFDSKKCGHHVLGIKDVN